MDYLTIQRNKILETENQNLVAALNPRISFLEPFLLTFDPFKDNQKAQNVEQKHLTRKQKLWPQN